MQQDKHGTRMCKKSDSNELVHSANEKFMILCFGFLDLFRISNLEFRIWFERGA